MIENKEVILQSRIEQLESDKAELIELLKKILSFATKDGWIDRIISPFLKKHGVKI